MYKRFCDNCKCECDTMEGGTVEFRGHIVGNGKVYDLCTKCYDEWTDLLMGKVLDDE